MSSSELPMMNTLSSESLPSYSPTHTHLKTYTAGEDGSRLADMAKEFGLAQQRQPRKQVRAKATSNFSHNTIMVHLLDPSFEDARMRAVWTSHDAYDDYDDDDDYSTVAVMARDDRVETLYTRWNTSPSWKKPRLESIGEAEDGEMDPHAQGVGGNLTSAVLGIIKGMVGPAILYLPHGFASAGYSMALPIMGIATIMYLHSSRCLLDSWKLESDSVRSNSGNELMPLQRKKPRQRVILSYPELAYRAFGTFGESLVKTGIALMQSGVCLTYLIFVPQNLHTSLHLLFGWNVSPEYWLIVMIVLQIPLSWIRDIRKFTITNLMANGLILYGLLTCLGFAFDEVVTDSDTPHMPLESVLNRLTHLDAFQPTWFLFIGTSVLLFEGSITLMVPLQEAVHTDEDRAKFPTVYRRVVLGIIMFYAFFGMTCWISFGDTVRTVLTTSLPAGYLATSVQFAYSIAVIFTFPLQNFPALEIACRSIAKTCYRCGSRKGRFWTKRNFISSILVCLLALVAVTTMNALDKVVSLMGSLLGCPIAFVFPPLIHTRLDPNLSRARKAGNYLVAGLGVAAMIMASITTILEW